MFAIRKKNGQFIGQSDGTLWRTRQEAEEAIRLGRRLKGATVEYMCQFDRWPLKSPARPKPQERVHEWKTLRCEYIPGRSIHVVSGGLPSLGKKR